MFGRVCIGAVFAVGFSFSASAGESDKWGAYVDVEGKLGTDRNLGEVSLFVPLGQSQESLFYGNLISRLDDQDSFEGNVGLGYREIVDGSYILGGYGYFDRRRSAHDNYFSQITVGAEFMTDVWTARANAYLADKDLALTNGGAVSQSGTQIFVQSNLEGALSGFDAEVGRVIPLGLEDVTLSGFAGGFHFDRSGFDNVSGPRARAELTLDNLWDGFLPSATQLRFGAEFQHDDVRDGQGFVSARLRIPLFGGDTAPRRNALDRRMVDPVVRDIDVVAGSGLSAPVAPLLESGGPSIQGAVFVDGDDDLGDALAAAGTDTIIIVDGSAGNVTSATDAEALSGQTIVGAQAARFDLIDPLTGATISWSPTPNGTRPVVSDTRLLLPGRNTVEGLDFDGATVSAGFFGLAYPPVTSDFVLSDLGFSGAYEITAPDGATTFAGILSVLGAGNVVVRDIAFDDISYGIASAGNAWLSALVVFSSEDVSISNVTASDFSFASVGHSFNASGINIFASRDVSVTEFSASQLSASITGTPAPPAFGSATGVTLTGMHIEISQGVTVADSFIDGLSSTYAGGDANTTAIGLLGFGGSATLSDISIANLSEAGTNPSNTAGVSLGNRENGLLSGIVAGADSSLTADRITFDGLTSAFELDSGSTSSTWDVSGSDNVLGAGVTGCNDSGSSITVNGAFIFTDSSTCP